MILAECATSSSLGRAAAPHQGDALPGRMPVATQHGRVDRLGIAAEPAAAEAAAAEARRRRDERLQDVPVVVNVGSSETLNKLYLRNFADITAVVPGLALTANANESAQLHRCAASTSVQNQTLGNH